jgi:hypothetical protein
VSKWAVDWPNATFGGFTPLALYEFASPFNFKALFFTGNPRIFELTCYRTVTNHTTPNVEH